MWNKCSKNIQNGTAVYHLIMIGQLHGLYSCQSQSGVSLSLHLGSKMKIYLWPQKQLDMAE